MNAYATPTLNTPIIISAHPISHIIASESAAAELLAAICPEQPAEDKIVIFDLRRVRVAQPSFMKALVEGVLAHNPRHVTILGDEISVKTGDLYLRTGYDAMESLCSTSEQYQAAREAGVISIPLALWELDLALSPFPGAYDSFVSCEIELPADHAY